jgi:hypothetical protein
MYENMTNKEVAEAFKKSVNSGNDIVVARMAFFLDEDEQRRKMHNKIEDDVKHGGPGSYNVVFLDTANNIAVLEDLRAAKKGPYKYIAALLSTKTDRWHTASSYELTVHVAYVRGVSEMFLGRNNQLAVFFGRMLVEVKE